MLLSDSKRYFNFWHWTFLSKLLTGHCYYVETPACICGWWCCCGWCWCRRLRQISVSTQGEARHAISLRGITAVVWPAGRVGEALVHAVLRCATIRLWSVFAASIAPGPVGVTCNLMTSSPSKSSWKMHKFLFTYYYSAYLLEQRRTDQSRGKVLLVEKNPGQPLVCHLSAPGGSRHGQHKTAHRETIWIQNECTMYMHWL